MAQTKRYQKLGYSESIPKIHRYPPSCKELSFILRNGYSKFPKNLQSLLFQDVLTAFRLLPGMQTRNAVSVARLLFQSAEASLPKLKKNLAVAEFKQAMVAHKRRSKTCQEDKGCFELPQDVLLHIFGFLDLQSLVSVGGVCWSWNLAASDDMLWRAQYTVFFGNSGNPLNIRAQKHTDDSSLEEEIDAETSIDWKEAFKRKYKGMPMKSLTSGRGYCRNCKTIVWLVNMKCPNEICQLRPVNKQIKPASLGQVLRYIVDGCETAIYYSESESDSEEDSPRAMCRYWVIPFPDQHNLD